MHRFRFFRRTLVKDGRLWVCVKHAGGRDYVTIALDENGPAVLDTRDGRLATDAPYAAVRLDPEGALRSSHLVAGSLLRFGGHRLEGSGRLDGEIRKVIGRHAGKTALEVPEVLPEFVRGAAKGPVPVLLITFPDGSIRGYNVTAIKNTDGGSRIHVREAAGLVLEPDRIELTSYPRRTIDGTRIKYRLITSAHAR